MNLKNISKDILDHWLVRRLSITFKDPVADFLDILRGDERQLPFVKEAAIVSAVLSGHTVYVDLDEWDRLRWNILYWGSGPITLEVKDEIRGLLEDEDVVVDVEEYDEGRYGWIEIYYEKDIQKDYYRILWGVIIEVEGCWLPRAIIENYTVEYLFSTLEEEDTGEVKLFIDEKVKEYIRQQKALKTQR